MNAAQINLISEVTRMLRDLEIVGTDEARRTAHELITRTHQILAGLGPVEVADLAAAIAAA